MKEERRRAVRIKKSLIVQYSRTFYDDTKYWDITTIKDISETGMCIITNKNFSPNETVSFRVKIPSRPFEWLEFTGRIVDIEISKLNTYITRVEFVDLTEEQKNLIKEYINWFLGRKHYKA